MQIALGLTTEEEAIKKAKAESAKRKKKRAKQK